MKKIIISLLLLIVVKAQAVPSYPGLISFRQPANGETVSIYLKGDERVHWAETEDGYSLMHGDDGSLVFAMLNENGDMVPSTFLAADKEKRSSEVNAFLENTKQHLLYSRKQIEDMLKIWDEIEKAKKGPKAMSEVVGEKKFLLILFEFSDKHFSHSRGEFAALMNQVNYTTNGHNGSVHDYYYDVSGGLFSLNMDVVGPFRGKYNGAHYGNQYGGYQQFAREAVDSAAKYVNFADYDNDSDGYIDGLHIIFAGYGEEAGGGSDCIWSHKSYIYDAPVYNNTVVDLYSCSPECSGYFGGFITNIGVICHELGHVFGAPDFYDTDYGESGGEYPGLGKWDLMSAGSWNCDGASPAHHNPYTKTYIYNWTTCTTLTNSPARYQLSPAETSNSAFFRVNTSTSGDFFLIENRQNIKWDECLPSHGMVVYHIHPNANGAMVSNATHPQQIYILAKTSSNYYPNSTPSSYGSPNSGNATFPGSNGMRDSLTDNSMPWFRPWSQQPNNFPIYNIAEDPITGMVYFSVQDLSPEPMNPLTEGLDNDKIQISWTRYGNRKTLVLINSDADIFGTPSDTLNVGDTLPGGGIVAYFNSGNRAVAYDLPQRDRHYFKLFTLKNDLSFSDGITIEGSTLDCVVSEWNSEDFESTSTGDSPYCWTGEWTVQEIEGQKALASPQSAQTPDLHWTAITSRPILTDSISRNIIQYSVHFFDGCDPQTKLRVEYQPSATSDWEVIDSLKWDSELQPWNTRCVIIDNMGDYSRLRFSLLTDGSKRAAIDNIELVSGWIINATQGYGGTIDPLGFSVVPIGDSIEFIVTPNPGYEIHRLVYDSHVILPGRLTPLGDRHFSYKIAETGGSHNLQAVFKRNTAIETVEGNNITVYPNPTNGQVTIQCEANKRLNLYDTRGSLIVSKQTTGTSTTIDMSDLPKGIYFLDCDKRFIKIVRK